MVRLEHKHFKKEFRTKFKLFPRITEWRKTTSFLINLDVGGAAWIRDAVNSVLRQEPVEELKRFYRAHNYRVIIESSRNSARRFMKICKIQNGFLSICSFQRRLMVKVGGSLAAALTASSSPNTGKGKSVRDFRK